MVKVERRFGLKFSPRGAEKGFHFNLNRRSIRGGRKALQIL
jgi:hypothetical protein